MAKISVVVPVYNVEKYLKECIDSIINQTLEDIEIICVNDGSTDSSLEILNDYAKKDSRIIVINKSNSGYGHTMNMGLNAATGEYVGIIESDDFADKNMFEDLYKLAKEYDADIFHILPYFHCLQLGNIFHFAHF
jgi:glycosyltransferase involved in cell wall biosynthesis